MVSPMRALFAGQLEEMIRNDHQAYQRQCQKFTALSQGNVILQGGRHVLLEGCFCCQGEFGFLAQGQ